jgi:molybdopterin-guanine dinucleotide biosynthesis protein A
VVVAKAETPLPPLDVPVWIEPPRPHHPLCGVLEALRRAEGPALVCAGDMPFVEPRLLAWLAGLGVPLAVPRLGGRLHPLLGLYDPRLLPALEKDLGAELPLRESVERLRAREVTESELARFGEPERLLFNVNTPQDLREAEQVLSAGEGN